MVKVKITDLLHESACADAWNSVRAHAVDDWVEITPRKVLHMIHNGPWGPKTVAAILERHIPDENLGTWFAARDEAESARESRRAYGRRQRQLGGAEVSQPIFQEANEEYRNRIGEALSAAFDTSARSSAPAPYTPPPVPYSQVRGHVLETARRGENPFMSVDWRC